ncbi:multiubiquitin domain-containing protein [Tahibacter amnicola]|uniref:Multiubiquitin domain-containing protein n=1 Tax=Tahibacter amnicola TaxID=2976241 RepID=A0ABY6B7Q8_9GAMM|nr:multiubiquitin domain-containing protein [Tahibacter amnicola]UXI66128.1 multiubiquitin domain-containing protein [Tahibacter amnicola]
MSNQEHERPPHDVRIHIDHNQYQSPTPTTGNALYALGNVAANRQLFRQAHGNQDDVLIERSDDPVDLKQGDHFYSHKEFRIVVNAQEKLWNETTISFEQVTLLAFPNPPPGIVITYTVEYEAGPRPNPEGSMTAGQSVRIKNGMIFSVTETGRS